MKGDVVDDLVVSFFTEPRRPPPHPDVDPPEEIPGATESGLGPVCVIQSRSPRLNSTNVLTVSRTFKEQKLNYYTFRIRLVFQLTGKSKKGT